MLATFGHSSAISKPLLNFNLNTTWNHQKEIHMFYQVTIIRNIRTFRMGHELFKLYLFLSLISTSNSNPVIFNSEDRSYEDLLVAISSDIAATNADKIIKNIKEWVTRGSELLYSSTYGWAYFKSVKILLPPTWDNIENVTAADYEIFEDSEIRVETENPIHGKSPFTVQHGECGDPGEYVQVPSQYLTNLQDFEATIGPAGQVFVHNWAKLRYGVFDEFGCTGDKLYPMFYQRQDGNISSLSPNICSNVEVTGSKVDVVTGGQCSYDDGLLDDNCGYVVEGPDELSSSILGIPYLLGSDKFCDETEEHRHNPDIPTRQNEMCHGQSAFSVIKKHSDFAGFVKGNITKDTTPTFTIMRQNKKLQACVLVLDTSSSMKLFNRIGRVKQAVKRFLELDITDNIPVGVVQFSAIGSDQTKIVQEIVPVTNESRPSIIKIIEGFTLHPDTCIGNGLKLGLQALKNYNILSGGVMIFLTDGINYCAQGLTIEDVIEDIFTQNVRVVTVAIGSNAQKNIEDLAKRSRGKAYFVNDETGPEDLNTALAGALTYQPSTTSDDKEIVLIHKTFSSLNEIIETITIDQYMGKDLKLEVDLNSTSDVVIETNLSGDTKSETFSSNIGVLNQSVPLVSPGNYFIKINSTSNIAFSTIKVKSKPPSGVLPLSVDCWSSIGEDDLILTGDSPGKVAIMARVTQGQNPIIGADVRAILDMGQGPIELLLSDEGNDPDTVSGDGVYARYFTKFLLDSEETRYTLKCEIRGSNTTMLNKGPTRSHRTHLSCSGSSLVRSDSVLTPAGVFSRSGSGGMITVGPTTGLIPGGVYPPASIRDLTVGGRGLKSDTFTISFTAVGEDLDEGIVATNQLFFSPNKSLLVGDITDMSDVELVSDNYLVGDSSLDPVPAYQVVRLTLNKSMFNMSDHYFFRVKATDQGGMFSFSNIAGLFLTDVATDQQLDKQTSALYYGAGLGSAVASAFTLIILYIVKRYRENKKSK